jgi:membrane protein DedA with SNARE-associated domain
MGILSSGRAFYHRELYVEHALSAFLSRFTYVAIWGSLAAAGLGAPISEDLVLLIAGGLVAREVTAFWPSLLSGYLGVILGDVLIHHWGWRMGPAAYKHRIVQRVLSPEKQEKLREHFARHGFWTVVVGRHTPVFRAPTFFLAGASKVPILKFVLADALSAAVTVPIVFLLGYYFGEHLDDVRKLMHKVHYVVIAVAVVALIAWYYRRRRKRMIRQ